jgi:hypothetical protein
VNGPRLKRLIECPLASARLPWCSISSRSSGRIGGPTEVADELGIARPTGPVAAELTPPGTVLLAERTGHTGGGLDPEDAERVRRRGYAVGSQRAPDRVDCAAAPVRVAAGRFAQTNGLL